MRAALCVAVLSLAAACGVSAADPVAETSPCRMLAYGTGGPTRAAYLPCAGEIMTTLERVDSATMAALDGDSQKRREGRAAVRHVIALMKSAGGRKLLDRWADRALTSLNVDIHNALSHYDTFYLMPIKKEPHPFAAKMREAAAAEALGGRRNYQSALITYRRLR